jgi:hypothetical protein
MSNRFRQATVYVNPSLNNPSELVKPTEEVKTETPTTQTEIDNTKAEIEAKIKKLEEDKQKELSKELVGQKVLVGNLINRPPTQGIIEEIKILTTGNRKGQLGFYSPEIGNDVFSNITKTTELYSIANKINAKYDTQIAQKQAELKALESKPLESSEKSSILSPLNTTETIIEQQEKLKENMTDISSPVTREPNKINLEANQEAIAKQKESLTKNTMSAAEKLAARKKDCNQKK